GSYAGEAGVELLLAAQQAVAGDADVVEDDLGGVGGADAVLPELLAHGQAGRAGRDDERGLAAGAELGVDGGDDDVHVGDAAVGGPGLDAVDDPVAVVVHGAGADGADVGAGVGLGGAEGAELDVVLVAEHLGQPRAELLGGAVAGQGGGGQAGADDRQGDAGVAPDQLLEHDGHRQPARLEPLGGEEVQGVQADLGGFLDDRPGGLLALVPFGAGRADHVAGEGVHPVPDLDHVV